MALSAAANLFSFAAQRHQSGLGWYYLSPVILCVSADAITLCHKDERVLAQELPCNLVSCSASAHSEDGRRLRLLFAPASTRARVAFDVELQNTAEAALLKYVCDALLQAPQQSLAILARRAAARGLPGADGAVLKHGELQRYGKGWHAAMLIHAKLFLFSLRSVALGDIAAMQCFKPRHVFSLAGATISGARGSRHFTLASAAGDIIQLSAPTWSEAGAWREALRGAAVPLAPARQPEPPAAAGTLLQPPALLGGQPGGGGGSRHSGGGGGLEADASSAAAAAALQQQVPARRELGMAHTPAHSLRTRAIEPARRELELVPQTPSRSRRSSEMLSRAAGSAIEEELYICITDDEAHGALASQWQPQPGGSMDAAQPHASSAVVGETASSVGTEQQRRGDDAEQRCAAALQLQRAWVPRDTIDQVEDFLRLFPEVPRADVYRLQREFDAFDVRKQGALEVDAALRLLESRREARTFLELRHMAEDVHIHASTKRRLSFLEWACTVFHKSWLDVCVREAAKVGAAAEAQLDAGDASASARAARYQTSLAAAREHEQAEAEQQQRDLAQRRAELRKRGERFEHAP